MHGSLFDKEHNEIWNEYYKNIKNKLIKDDDNDFGYHFNDEDFYVYFVLHIYKHFYSVGISIRNLLDIFIYLNKKSNLDFDYINKQIEILDFKKFETDCKMLSREFFTDPDNLFSKKFDETLFGGLDFMQKSNVYGNDEISMEKKLKEMSKTSCFFRRLFPPVNNIYLRYPISKNIKF